VPLPENFFTFASQERQNQTGGARQGVRPDAVRAVIGPPIPFGTQYPNSSFFEVKALKQGSVTMATSQSQILGMLDVLENSAAGQSPSHPPFPVLSLITTANTQVGQDVTADASARGIAIWHARPFIVLRGGNGIPATLRVGSAFPMNPTVYGPRALVPPTPAGRTSRLRDVGEPDPDDPDKIEVQP
jgi:hypothetical protein